MPCWCAATTFRASRKCRLPPTTCCSTSWRAPMPGRLELYGTHDCPFTVELREQLEWNGRDFADYDVAADSAALARLAALIPGPLTVPVLVEDGRVLQVGWQGRGCGVTRPAGSADEP